MKYLLDTCVITELVRPKPTPSVVAWIRRQQEDHLFLSVLTLGELRKGIERLTNGRRGRLESWLNRDLKMRFAGRWLPIDDETAERWGMLAADAARRGILVPVVDALLAASALAHGMTLVTRNTQDVQATGVLVMNPWTDEP